MILKSKHINYIPPQGVNLMSETSPVKTQVFSVLTV